MRDREAPGYAAAPPRNPQGWGGRAAANPYPAPSGFGRQRMRAGAMSRIKVFYDRSRAGDALYFDHPCPALLAVDGSGALTVTPGCGEAPLVIPASDVTAIRMNVAVAKEDGAFHIETRKGIYLMVAADSGSRDDSLSAIRALRLEWESVT